MKYTVETRITNSGKVIIGGIRLVEDTPINTFRGTERADIYIDVFPTREDALSYIERNKDK